MSNTIIETNHKFNKTKKNTPRSSVQSVSIRVPLQSVSIRVPLQSVSIRVPLKSVSIRVPLQSVSQYNNKKARYYAGFLLKKEATTYSPTCAVPSA
ncbi:MAG: hypothetical protein PHE45_09710 [Bacteroidales bacterium]|nr:hypothetical protein [Bacteroidales bacterium]